MGTKTTAIENIQNVAKLGSFVEYSKELPFLRPKYFWYIFSRRVLEKRQNYQLLRIGKTVCSNQTVCDTLLHVDIWMGTKTTAIENIQNVAKLGSFVEYSKELPF